MLNWFSKTEGPDKLRPEEWRRKVLRWVEDAGITAKSAPKGVYDHVVESFSNFEHHRILLKSCVIRNLLQHNKGIMNDRNYKIAPICKIGEKPKWDQGLYHDFIQALHLYNDYLNNVVSESPDHDIRS